MNKRVSFIPLSSYPTKRNAAGKLVCVNCGKELIGRCTKWCSWKCTQAVMLRGSHAMIRAKIIKEKGGVCDACGWAHPSNELILDHVLPIALGGAEFEESNLQILCRDCNKTKTAQDMKNIARARSDNRLAESGQQKLC